MPGHHARQTPERAGGVQHLTRVIQCYQQHGGRQEALSHTGTPGSGPVEQAALGMSSGTKPQS